MHFALSVGIRDKLPAHLSETCSRPHVPLELAGMLLRDRLQGQAGVPGLRSQSAPSTPGHLVFEPRGKDHPWQWSVTSRAAVLTLRGVIRGQVVR